MPDDGPFLALPAEEASALDLFLGAESPLLKALRRLSTSARPSLIGSPRSAIFSSPVPLSVPRPGPPSTNKEARIPLSPGFSP